MDRRKDTAVEAVLEHLIEHGPGDIATVFGRAFELAMRIERERFLRAGPYERTVERQGYANGYKPKRIDTPAGTVTVDVPKTADAALGPGTARFGANDLADALREKKRVDKDGREYRAFIPVRNRPSDGLPLFRWGDIDDAPRDHVEKHVQQERRSIVSDCYALQMKVDHYNAAHPDEEPIQLVLDFADDVAEAKIANGLDEGEAA